MRNINKEHYVNEQSEKFVVLTFDDGVKNHLTFVAPLLKELNFGATFFVSDDPRFQGGSNYLTWDDVLKISDMGFEIGNHLGKHTNVTRLQKEEFSELVRQVENRCSEKGIPKPVTFCYPGYSFNTTAVDVLQDLGYAYARHGIVPNFYPSDYGDKGPYYKPDADHPLLIPTTYASGPGLFTEDLVETLHHAEEHDIIVLTYHGVPDKEHHWVHTSPEDFTRQMELLREEGCRVIAMRDLDRVVSKARRQLSPDAVYQPRALKPTDLLCEYLQDPLGIDNPQPRFSWSYNTTRRDFMQRAYRILVSSTEADLAGGRGDMWDSGRIDSSCSLNVEYEGKSLESFEQYWWNVLVWDDLDREGINSEPARFEMGILEHSAWRGHWIGPGINYLANRVDSEIEEVLWSPLLRKEFSLGRQIKKARAYISGLGWHELYINGKKVGSAVLDPASTDYHKTVLYRTHDITEYLREGENALGIILGNGWYCEPRWRYAYAECPRALMYIRIEGEDGSMSEVVTDDTWRIASGPILENQFWGGEVYDARLEKKGWIEPGYKEGEQAANQSNTRHPNRGKTDYSDGKWRPAVINERPEGLLKNQLLPEMRVNEEPELVSLRAISDKSWICEMGEFFGGWIRIRVKGISGTEVKIRYSGRLGEDGTILQQRQSVYKPSTDIYILKGDPAGEVYEPRFSYHPVRYVQIEGDIEPLSPEDITGRKIYNSVDLSGGFECSNPMLNKIHRAVRRTMTNQLFGIPLDCLYREHWGWTDPATITGTIFPRLFMPHFWHKWLNDFKEAQRANGSIPDFAPDYTRRRSSDPAWGGNYPILIWYLYQYFGDISFLRRHYKGIKKQVRYFQAAEKNGILVEGHYGDHMLPGPAPGQDEFVSSETPRELVWTGYYYRGVSCVARIAEKLGHHEESREFKSLAERIKDAFNDNWFDSQNGYYASGSQTANFIALSLDIVPEGMRKRVLQHTVTDIQDNYHGRHHTGNTGTTCLIETLAPEGCGDVMYNMLNQTDYPGWGYMIANGATTIWESWSGPDGPVGDADSMAMFATVDKFFHNDLAGIKGPGYYRPDEIEPGFKKLIISPFVPEDLSWVRDRMKTANGTVISGWQKADEGFVMLIQVPPGSEAVLTVPVAPSPDLIIVEGALIIWQNKVQTRHHPGIKLIEEIGESIRIHTGCGRYRFVFNTDRSKLKTKIYGA